MRRIGPLRPVAGAMIMAMTVLGLVSCGSAKHATNVEIGNTLNYTSVGTTTTLDCDDGKSLTVGGSNNVLSVRGTCSTVSIGGADNRITLDKIEKQLNVAGVNNTITYKSGDPKLGEIGHTNTVNKS